MKNQLILIIFGIQHPDETLTLESYTLSHLNHKLLLHCLGKFKKLDFFQQDSVIISMKLLISLSQVSRHFHNCKTVKMSVTSPRYSECLKCTN